MNKKIKLLLFLVVMFFLILQMNAIRTQTRFNVKKAEPNKVKLEQGGKEVLIKLSGRKLHNAEGAVVGRFRGKKFLKSMIKTTILKKRSSHNRLVVKLSAGKNTTLGKNYTLRLWEKITRTKKLFYNLSPKILRIEVIQKIPVKMKISNVTKNSRKTILSIKAPLTSRKKVPSSKVPVKPLNVTIYSLSKTKLQIKNDGRAGIIVVNGRNLEQVTSAQVILNNQVVKNINVELGVKKGNSREIKFTALPKAKTGSNYKLRFLSGKNTVNIPEARFSINISSSKETYTTSTLKIESEPKQYEKTAQTLNQKLIKKSSTPVKRKALTITKGTAKTTVLSKDSTNRMGVAPNYGLPMISSHYPSKWQRMDFEITFKGRDLISNLFIAKIGSENLQITYRSKSEIRAMAPKKRMKGDLLVGYDGDPASNWVIEKNYEIFGDPVINSVTPSSFIQGDKVTIKGLDLQGAHPRKRNNSNYIKISNDSSSSLGDDFVRISSWKLSDDSKTITFFVEKAYNLSLANVTLLSPQPPSLSGKLRLMGTGTNQMVVVSPSSVTWREGLPDLHINSIKWRSWSTDFIIVKEKFTENELAITGQGLIGEVDATIGGLGCGTSFWNQGKDGTVEISYIAKTGKIKFVRSSDGATAYSPIITVVPSPKFTPTTLSTIKSAPFRIKLNTVYTLKGWYLKPGGVSGLTYELYLEHLDSLSSYFKLNIISHTASEIKFSIDNLKEIPAELETWDPFDGTPYNPNLILRAKYQDHVMEFVKEPYLLVWPYN